MSKYDDWFKGGDAPKPAEKPKKKAKEPKDSGPGFFSKLLNRVKPNKKKTPEVSSNLNADGTATTEEYDKELKESKIKAAFVTLGERVAHPFTQGVVHRGMKKLTSRPLLMKILFTLWLLLIFRIAATITMPGVEIKDEFKDEVDEGGSFLGIMNMMGGGTLRNFSIVTLGISPYITSSIIMQLLTSEAFPPLHRLNKSGPAGKRKINVITRIITLFLAVLQAVTIIQQISQGALDMDDKFDEFGYKYVAIPIILVAGSFFTLFLGEQITNKGVGNGTSLIIFSGIAASLPVQFRNAYVEIVDANSADNEFVGGLNFAVYCAVFVILIFIIGYIYTAERRVPIQQTGSGLQTDRSQMSHLPIKVNPAGVMPVIFSLALAVLPMTIIQFFDHQNEGRIWVEDNMKLTDPLGLGIFVGLTFMFTIVMALVTFNPYTVADGFKKNGTFIPGVRPGDETENYLTGIVLRLSIFSAFYLSAISAIKYIEEIIGLSSQITYGGTTLIILVSVAIETIGQLKARDKTDKIASARAKSISKAGDEGGGGLLW